jgi:hypothetical protein
LGVNTKNLIDAQYLFYKIPTSNALSTTGTGDQVTNLSSKPAILERITVTTASSTPLLQVLDTNNTVTAGAVALVDQFTPVAGTTYDFSFGSKTGLTVKLNGTVKATVVWKNVDSE